jgi:hypothetical protein
MASNAQPTWCHCQLGHNIPVVARSTSPMPRLTELTQGGSWRGGDRAAAGSAAGPRPRCSAPPSSCALATGRATQLAMVLGELVPASSLAGEPTLLEALGTVIAGHLAVVDHPSLSGTGQSSADVWGRGPTDPRGSRTAATIRAATVFLPVPRGKPHPLAPLRVARQGGRSAAGPACARQPVRTRASLGQ